MWVFHFTFGRFWLYVVANLLLDAFYAFVFHRIEEKLGIADLINVKHYHILLLMVGISFIYPASVSAMAREGFKKLEHNDHDDITSGSRPILVNEKRKS
ncbi:hypothetical protein [Paenibacillus sp. V4I5]|uniref:hypothetical protein n=1 Tax=Paenibacillus sp. V4I5 TaxID=3042306 RepID=UPI00278DA91A|nr:hypothetical protein [Paenibacillus sp. V4I5]MDQ0919280.1 hypothetical protein [Paenibacillus sp. V4I5]